jgi:hypothetical protein
MVRSLVEAGIITREETESGGHRPVVNADLQEDFSLNHALSLYALETLERLDPDSATYALDLVSLVEATLENPDMILMKQLDRLKTEKLSELKAAGVEYEERMAELEKLEYPKPNREFIYGTFNEFSRKHPWVGTENIRPKSVAREMYETYQSFAEYIKEYGLQRSEGLLLRYLSDTYKALLQTVPESSKTDDVLDVIAYFGEMLRGVDSSLIDEWERMRNPAAVGASTPAEQGPSRPATLTSDARAFTVLLRNAVFSFLRALATRDFEAATEVLGHGEDDYFNAERLEQTMASYFEEHESIRTDPGARSPAYMRIDRGREGRWRIEQTLVDTEDHNDWMAEFVVDLDASDDLGKPVITLRGLGPS